MKYIIGLGTNLGNKKKNIDRAVQAFEHLPKCTVLCRSALFETEPVGYAEQDSFYNACLEIESSLTPNEMLGVCLGIEAAFGRERLIKNGPRILDLDVILTSEQTEMNEENLILPHPRYTERRFVLIPLLDLFPNGEAYGVPFSHHLFGIKGQAIRQLSED